MGTHRKASKSTQLKKTFAVGVIAGAAAGFGALSLAPTAFADITNEDNEGWWLGSGNLNGNQTIFGNNGNGVVNQFGAANGNIMNNQTNIPLLSPQLNTGTAAQVNTPVNLNVPVTANTPVVTGNGAALGTTVGASPATAVPLGAALGGANLTGANAGAAVPINAGAAIPVQIPVQIPAAPILSTLEQTNTQTGVGAQQSGTTTGAIIDDRDTAEGGTNLQVAGAHSEVTGGNTRGGNTYVGGSATGGTIVNNNTPSNSAVAANNYANNSSNNNTVNNNGNNSSNSVGNDNENEND
jgi:hypothetical protein